MKKKVFVLIITIIMCFIFGCGEATQAKEQQNNPMEYIRDLGIYGLVEEWRDTETGVHYLIEVNNGRGAICPRYNADGSLYVDQTAR